MRLIAGRSQAGMPANRLPQPAVDLRPNPMGVCGVPSELLGLVTSPRRVQLVAYQHILIDGIAYRVSTDAPLFSYILKAPDDTILSREGRPPFQGRLNFFVPDAPMTLRASCPMTGVACFFGPDFVAALSEVEDGLRLGEIGLLADIESDRLVALGRAMWREAIDPGFASAVFADAVGMAVALEIARYDSALRSDDRPYRGGLAPWQMRRLESYVRDNLSRDLGLDELARLLGISIRHLSRAVRQARGVSVHRWVADCRLREARRLLAETNAPIHEIARRSAFRSASAFTAAFRAASGYSPGEFRRLTLREVGAVPVVGP
jgi:AraC-like DNA-binding protein